MTGDLGHPPRVFRSDIPGGAPGPAWRWAARLQRDDAREEAFLQDALDLLETAVGGLESGRIAMAATDPAVSMPGAAAENEPDKTVTLLAVDRIFGTEPLSAASPSLAEVTPPAAAVVHSRTAGELGLGGDGELVIATEEGEIGLPLQIDDRTAPGVIVVPRHHRIEWQALGGTRIILDRRQVKENKEAPGQGDHPQTD